MNTDLLGIKSNGIKQKHSPPLVGRVRRARILRCPIIDFSDPFVFEIIRRGSQIYYLTPLGLESKARKTKIRRQHLYRILSGEGNPTLGTLTSVLSSVGLSLDFSPQHRRPRP